MPRVSADTSEAREFSVLDNGWYPVEIAKVPEIGKAKSSGAPVISVEMDVIGGSDQQDGSHPEGRKLFKTVPLGGEGAGILLNFLDAFQVPYEKKGNKIDFDSEDCLQLQAEVKVRQRDYEGEKQPDVRRFRKIGGLDAPEEV